MEDADFIPLARAAALVHGRLFPGESVMDAKTLDLLAVAISALIPLYQRDMESGALRPVEDTAVARGRFTRGAARLEFPDRPPLRFLLVPRSALYAAMDTLARDPILRTCRRPQPGYSSATGA
jgi:hypothetical protein